MKFLRFGIIIFCSIFINSGVLFSQNSEVINSDSNTTRNIISIEEISGETELLQNRISSLKEVLQPSTQTLVVDSILDSAYIEIILNKDSLYLEIESLSRRDLKERTVSWKGYKSKLKSLQSILIDRISDITDVNDELVIEQNKWVLTKEKLLNNSESEDVFASLDTVILTINSLIDIAHVRLDSVFTIQKRLTELVLIVDEAISEISRIERQKQMEYFVFDSDPIWSKSTVDSTELDSAQMVKESNLYRFKEGINKDVSAFKNFFNQNLNTVILQIVVLIILLIIIIQMGFSYKSLNIESNDLIEIQTKKIFSHPIASTTVVGILFTAYFYEAMVPVFAEMVVILILFATIILLPEITVKKIRLFLILLFIGYLIQIFHVYFEPRSGTVRWLLFIESIILISGTIYARKVILSNPKSFDKTTYIFRFVAPIYVIFLAGSVILNAIGMVNFSNMLINGVHLSMALGMVVFLAVRVVTSILVLFFKLRESNNMTALSVMVDATNQRFKPVLVWIGMILWLYFTLTAFDVYANLIEWIKDLLQIGWHLGDMRISVGSILSFFLLFLSSLLLAKFIAAIFQDEWMIKALPRGVAPAISLLFRIVVISIGMYFAFNSAGFNLSELGFVFGALSVGIGFGLQNVVLNFIAGLILAFERPINLGDTIEIDQEMGVVTSIGVRSSNIRTYSGSEAIIPNGDLISKKVINWTLANRDRRSKILMKTAPNAEPEKVIELFNTIAGSYGVVFKAPAPKTYFYGYDETGNLSFALLYWTTFNDTLKTDSAIALEIFKTLKQEGIEAPMPNQRNFE